ncbi:MAG TPA: polysaccharide deacetylase, partial [Clostridia bacterium]
DRIQLETLAGYPVRGMSYPFGTYNDQIIGLIRSAGMEYARTTRATADFRLPDNFLTWHPTCHHAHDLGELLDRFQHVRFPNLQLFYLWGHSYEFNDNNNWAVIEDFCARAADLQDTWLATNIEIVDYMNALRGLRCSVDMKTIHNPSACEVWIEAEDTPIMIRAGETKKL